MNSQNQEKLSKKVVKGITFSYASAMINGVLHLGVLSIMAHLLSPVEFGLLGIALIFISFTERISQIGVGPALVQKLEISQRELKVAGSVAVVAGVIICIIFWVISPAIAEFFREEQLVPILRALALIFIIEGIGTVSDSCLQRSMRFKALLVVDNLSYFLGSGMLAVTLAYMGYGVWSLVLGVLGTRAVKVAMLVFFVPPKFAIAFRPSEASEMIRFGAGFSLSRILNFFAVQGDNFVVGRMLGTQPLGLYSRAYQLMTLPSTYFAQIIDRVMFPALSKQQGNQGQLRRAYLTSIEAITIVSLPLSAFLFLAAPEVVVVLFGQKWIDMIPVLRVLALGVFFRTGYKSGDTLTRALGEVYKNSFNQVIYCVLVIAGSVVGVSWGLEGVATAVLIAVAANYFITTLFSLKLINVKLNDLVRPHLPGVWISFWATAVLIPVLSLMRAADSNVTIRLIIAASVCFLTGFCSLLAAPKIFRSHSIAWFVRNLNLERLGQLGKGIHFLLARQTL